MSIGENIKNLRKSKGLSQKQLANKVGLSEITIRRYEKGINDPTTEVAEDIAIALEVSLAELIKEKVTNEKIKPFAPETLYKGEAYEEKLYNQLKALYQEKFKYDNLNVVLENLPIDVKEYIDLLEKIIDKTEAYCVQIAYRHVIEKKYYMENAKILDKIKGLVSNIPSIENEINKIDK